MLGGGVGVVGVADVGDEQLGGAVGSLGGLATVDLELGLVGSQDLGLELVGVKLLVGGLVDDLAVGAVDNQEVAVLDVGRAVGHGQDRGDLHGAGDDRGVGGTAARLGDDAHDVGAVDVGGHGRGELVHDDDRVLGKRRQVDELLAEQVGEQAGLDVGDVGSTGLEELVVHVDEHVVVHVVSLGNGLLGAHAVLDALVHGIEDALVLGELDMGAHNARLFFEAGGLHALDLAVGLLDEAVAGGQVAGLLGLLVLRRGGREGKVGLDGNAGDADTDAIRCINTFEHEAPPRLKLILTHAGGACHSPACNSPCITRRALMRALRNSGMATTAAFPSFRSGGHRRGRSLHAWRCPCSQQWQCRKQRRRRARPHSRRPRRPLR